MCSFGSGGGSAPSTVKVDPTPTQVTSVASSTGEQVLKKEQRKKRSGSTSLSTDRGTLLGGSGSAADMTDSNRTTLG